MIGCGGSGQKTVRYVRDSVKRHLEHQGWEGDFPQAWQFLGIDYFPTKEDPSIPFLPVNDYVSASLAFPTYQGLNQAIETKFGLEVNPTAFHDLQGWRPNPSQVMVPLRQSPGQLRAIGRLAGLMALPGPIAKRVSSAFTQCSAGGPELAEVSRHLGVNVEPGTPVPDPITIVVGSMAGGTGAGIMLDVVDLVRRTDIKGAFPVLVAFTPDIFGSIQTNAMTANSAAFMAEMLSAYWDDENTDSALIPATVAVNTRGPHSIFLVGRTNIDGLDLLDSKNVYRAVVKTLSAIVTSPTIQTSFHNFITVSWPHDASLNSGGYGFHSSRMKGVASSFGSATIAIGRDRFHDYLKHLLLRTILEHLTGGFEPVGNEVLGDAAKSMTNEAKIAELAHRNIDRFVSDCGLSECESELNEIGSRFLSNESIAPGETSTNKDLDQMFRDELRQWGSNIFRKTLIATNEYTGSLSMPVVLLLLKLCQKMLVTKSSLFRVHEEKDVAKGMYSTPNNFARERLAIALESVATTMLSGIEASVNQSLARINWLTRSQDGSHPVVAGWPKNDGIVPTSFNPSPVEFFLEECETWPAKAKQLLSKSLGDPAGLPIDPVEAARLLIIRGGFGGDRKGGAEVTPLIWADSHGSEPVWEPGQQIPININDDIKPLTERIDSWLMRPATEMLYALTEGLSSYLKPTTYNSTGAAIADHQQRLASFYQKLTLALMQSRPLVEIDLVMNSEVHPMPLSYNFIFSFPFGKGHPAREGTEQVIQKFFNDARDVDWAFSSGDAESVLITSFLANPVNPSVITSFTQPLHKALGAYTPELLRSSFWLWRRSRVLENFVPLPYELRVAAIRGFAISRILGTMTALPVGQNKIATEKGVFNFPRNLLTETDKNNILPALLEAMVLTFAEAPTSGKAAFSAYGALIDYGTGGVMVAGFEIDGVTAHILKTGEYGNVEIVDDVRADSLLNDPQGRIKHAIAYLDVNIERFDAIESRPMDPHSWRNQVGAVDPVDTLTRELLPDLRRAYVMVREAIERFERSLNHDNGDVV